MKNNKINQTLEAPDIETASAAYALRFDDAWGTYLLARQEALIAACLPESGGLRVLCVGGGHAQLAALYQRRGDQLTVYGSEGASLELLQPYECEYHSGNILQLPFEDNHFDVVVAIRLLTHLNNWPEMIKEMCRVSRGQVVLEYPSVRSLNVVSPLLFKFKKQIETDTRTFTLFKDSEIKQQLAKYGFTTEYRKGQFFFPLVVHRMLKSNGLLRALESLLSALRLTAVLGSPVILSARNKR